jgi:hypothetical protein
VQNDNFAKQLTALTIISARATGVTGGYIKIGKLVFVSIQFTAAITNISTVLFQGLPEPDGSQPLNAINVTDNALTTCSISTSYGYFNINCTSGKAYIVSGCYVAKYL